MRRRGELLPGPRRWLCYRRLLRVWLLCVLLLAWLLCVLLLRRLRRLHSLIAWLLCGLCGLCGLRGQCVNNRAATVTELCAVPLLCSTFFTY